MSFVEFDLPAVRTTVPLPPVAQLHVAAEPRLTNRSDSRAFSEEREFDEEELSPSTSCAESAALQRVREVRREQGVSLRRAAQLMQCSGDQARALEEPSADLTLSQLYDWQRVLEVPVADLLVEPHAPLSAPVLERARMVRLMKTVQAIVERSNQPSVRRLAETMARQLVEVMPELEGVSPWHSIDRRKTCNQNARILESEYLRTEHADDR